MASFEQDGRNRENHRQAVAVHRQKPVQGRAISCCDPAGGGAEAASTTRSVQVNMPDTRSWEKADREMIRNHATADEVLLPSMKAPLFEEADADMDIMFHLSNASWMTGVATADNDIDLGFRIENMSLPGINAILEGDAELHTRFQAEHVTT